MLSTLGLCCLLLLNTGAQGFGILPGKSLNHLEITESAILNTTVQVCRALAQAEGTDFITPAQPFTADAVAVACGTPKSSKNFRQAITFITLRNIRVDIRHALNASFHFDEEMFIEGRRIITEGILAVKASNKEENFEAARQKLAEIFHPLQDFYSHSNWVELGSKLPNSNLIRSDTSIGNIADESRATCRNCDGDDCTNNILEDITEQSILTSGYFGVVPFLSTKPKGKCSHGGAVDQTSTIEPKGGINKDTFESSHGHLHLKAANLAIAATSELLEDIRGAAGDRPFLQYETHSACFSSVLYRGRSSKALCFVIDTTKSMSDDIEVVKTVTSSIINSEVGTEDEPSLYILVPFDDPNFGPLIRTTDPNVFKNAINALSPSGGGDDAELSLSALQLALTSAPSNSEIFLFTDAPAKDTHLKSTVIALIERTQSVVNIMITGSTVENRRRRREGKHVRITASDAQLYRDLAQASGGQAIEVTKSELPVAINIITESSSSSLPGVPGKADNFTFFVDETVTNLRVYITGRSVSFTLISPTGQSPIDFLFDFVKVSQGLFSGFDALDSRPTAGVNGSLLVSLTGTDSATVTEVALVESSGSAEIKGVVEAQGSGNFLVHIARIPSVEFVVRVKGQNGSVFFQRQSCTNFRSSNLTITVTDFTNPACQLISLQSNCSENCSLSTWELSALVTDGAEGTGVDRVSLKQGNGTMNTSLVAGNENMTLVSYSASCCSPDMELLAVDRVGNVGTCFYTIRELPPSALSVSTKATQSFFLCISIVMLGLHVLTEQ
ncbi:von Willebrand factor A domain-containing protein 7 [Nibea albiflora]|uniref:von Willebrand factor A domain-containing protein 7 n=1 Tax=Nibea albiflora TaxID=240163 RepID=A0ACB7F0R6_NIBAL|nr:von Willebrand factor A domain-containing protein 7 [Nibea albiflora]